ncbi:MAG: hypothetical protein CL402_07020 [Acidiferrobacteraceae bacterium]|nr:hypothetical protein [Acidiferrobacteraceae bacterium]
MYRRPICDPASLAMIKDIEQQLLEKNVHPMKKTLPVHENVSVYQYLKIKATSGSKFFKTLLTKRDAQLL